MEAAAIERDFWEARYWQAIVNREPDMDGAVYYGVLSTGVYCRPSCGARRPRRENVVFFSSRGDAEQAGFRACLRCRPDQAAANPRVRLVLEVCRHLEAHPEGTPTLPDLARAVGGSPFHIQRTFKAILGVSPRAWAEARRLERFKRQSRGGASVTGALYEAGYNSSSALYGRGASQLGMTPKAYLQGGQGIGIAYTVFETALGKTLVAATGRGICAVRFGESESAVEADVRAEFPGAEIKRADQDLAEYARAVAALAAGRAPDAELPLDVRATAFERRVWEALRAIPRGQTRCYAEVAEAVGKPRAARAVARACAANPVALLIPCHRVIRRDGQSGGYRWGADRKASLLKSERESQY
jgi:AraC family transcriptional regulator, regulatory protein of adaptative response / methylated-DNA-[protein]-cysteine methyltransferase